MTDRYSFRDVAAIFDIPESRLRYWAQTGFINPSIRAGGRRYYTFRDLIQIRAARDLMVAGASLQRVRKNLDSLRALLPDADYPASRMRILSDGETVVARTPDDVLLEPLTGQLVLDFSVDALSEQVADVLALPTSLRSAEIGSAAAEEPALADLDDQPSMPAIADLLLFEPLLQVFSESAEPDSVPTSGQTFDIQPVDTRPDMDIAYRSQAGEYRPVGDRAVRAYPLASAIANDELAPPAATRSVTEPRSTIDKLAVAIADGLARAGDDGDDGRADSPAQGAESAYDAFMRGCDAEDNGDLKTARTCYQRALKLQPTLSSAHTNLGHVHYRLGARDPAQEAFERALELEPVQPEARFNLAILLEDSGDVERAIGHLHRILWTHPRFADAHYNLARLLARKGQAEKAREHLTRYLQLDSEGDWSTQARGLLNSITVS